MADRRGDIYNLQGKTDEAKAEYQQGLDQACDARRRLPPPGRGQAHRARRRPADPDAGRSRRQPPSHDRSMNLKRLRRRGARSALPVRRWLVAVLAACSAAPRQAEAGRTAGQSRRCSACARPGPAQIRQGRLPAGGRRQRQHGRGRQQRRHRGRARRAHRPRDLARQRRRAARRRRRQRRHASPPWSRATTNWSRCDGGKVLWRAEARRRRPTPRRWWPARRVFVLAADRTGQRLRRPDRPPPVDRSSAPASRWCCARPACCWPWATRWWSGMGGRLVGPEPRQWHRRAGKRPIASAARHQRRRAPGRPGRHASAASATSVCARAFQASRRLRRRRARQRCSGRKPANGAEGVGGDDAHRLRHRERRHASSPGAAPTASAPGSTTACKYRDADRAAGARPLGRHRRQHRPACTCCRAKTARC